MQSYEPKEATRKKRSYKPYKHTHTYTAARHEHRARAHGGRRRRRRAANFSAAIPRIARSRTGTVT